MFLKAWTVLIPERRSSEDRHQGEIVLMKKSKKMKTSWPKLLWRLVKKSFCHYFCNFNNYPISLDSNIKKKEKKCMKSSRWMFERIHFSCKLFRQKPFIVFTMLSTEKGTIKYWCGAFPISEERILKLINFLYITISVYFYETATFVTNNTK